MKTIFIAISRFHVDILYTLKSLIDVDCVVFGRGIARPTDLEIESHSFEGFVLNDPGFILSLLKSREQFCLYLPAVDSYLFFIASLLPKRFEVNLIEDGWSSWIQPNYGMIAKSGPKPFGIRRILFVLILKLYCYIFGHFSSLSVMQRVFRLFCRSLRDNYESFNSKAPSSYALITSLKPRFVNHRKKYCPPRFPPASSFTREYSQYTALFLNPRYLIDSDSLISYMSSFHCDYLLVCHPSFWKSDKQHMLERFKQKLQEKAINYRVHSTLPFFGSYEVCFELHARGIRSIMVCDSTIQLIIDDSSDYFKGLTVHSISKLIDGKMGILEGILGYTNSSKSY